MENRSLTVSASLPEKAKNETRNAAAAESGRGIALLVSRYPAVSHTFILREVRGLQSLGLRVETASINPPDRDSDRLSAQEREEAARTFYVKQQGNLRACFAHLSTLLHKPRAYLRGLLEAVRLGSGELMGTVMHFFYFTEALLLGQWMKSRRLDHLHVHFATAAASVALLVSKTFNVGFSITVHGPDEFYDVSRHRLRQKFGSAQFILCIGQFARSQVVRLMDAADWSRVRVVRLGVPTNDFQPPVRGIRRTFEVICVGRLVPEKGQGVLVAAVQKLLSEGRDVRLRLVGDGPGRLSIDAQIEERWRDRIVLEGAVNPERIPQMLSQASAFVLASFAEGIPVALMEAMCMEIPCISTFVNGIPELIDSGIDGLLVPPSDVSALAEAIGRLIDDTELRSGIGRAGREKVIAKYNLKTNLRELSEIWKHQLSRA